MKLRLVMRSPSLGFLPGLPFVRHIARFLLLAVLVVSFLQSSRALADGGAPYATVAPQEIPANSPFSLEIHVPYSGESENVGTPSFVHSELFDFRRSGVAHRVEIVNGNRSAEKVFSFEVSFAIPTPPGKYRLPVARIPVDGATAEVSLPVVTVVEDNTLPSGSVAGGQGNTAPVAGNGFAFNQSVDSPDPFVGQQVVYSIDVVTTADFLRANLGDIALPDFFRASFGKLAEQKQEVGNSVHHIIREGIFPLHAGTLVIPQRSLEAELRARPARAPSRRAWDIFDDVFSDLDPLMPQEVLKRRFTAAATQVHVRDLPPPEKPLSGVIPVGDLSIHSQIDQQSVEEGGSLTLTIDIVSDGNLTPYELPKPIGAAGDFKIYVDKPNFEITPTQNRILFKKSFTVTLVPQRSGALTLPVYPITYFHARQQKYATLNTTNETVHVTPRERGKEQVVVHNAPPPATENVQKPEKQEIVTRGEDLFPQHVGAVLRKNRRLPRLPAQLTYVLLLPVGALTCIRALRRRREIATDPSAGRAALAHRAARKALAADSASPEALLNAFQTYVSMAYNMPMGSFTSADVPKLLPPAKTPPELIEELGQLLRELQAAVFGGAAISTERLAALHQLTARCIDRIEQLRVKL